VSAGAESRRGKESPIRRNSIPWPCRAGIRVAHHWNARPNGSSNFRPSAFWVPNACFRHL